MKNKKLKLEEINRPMNIYSIYDVASEMHSPIFEAVNDRTALREVRALIEKMDETSKRDFKLFYVGITNKRTGVIDQDDIREVTESTVFNKENITDE